jgi:hypothetical protein
MARNMFGRRSFGLQAQHVSFRRPAAEAVYTRSTAPKIAKISTIQGSPTGSLR